MKKIKVKPLNKWAKERVKQHGSEFEVVQEKQDRILVKSLEKTWRLKPGVPDFWMAWFVFNKDIETNS